MKRLKYLPFAMLFVLALLYHFGSSSLLIHPHKRSSNFELIDHIIKENNAQMNSLRINADNAQLVGYFARQEEPTGKTVVLLHGVGGASSDLTKELRLFLKAGYNVAAIDARAHGDSEGAYCTFGYHEVSDYSKLLDVLEDKFGQDEFSIFGHSMGAAVAIQCAGSDERYKSLVAFAPFKDLESISLEYMGRLIGLRSTFLNSWMLFAAETRADFDSDEVSPLLSAKKVICPTLIVHGAKDIHIPLAHSQEIHTQIEHSNKEFVSLDAANHVSLWSEGGRELELRVLQLVQSGWK